MERTDFQKEAWVAIRGGGWGQLRWRLGVRRGKRTTLRSALAQADGRLVMARHEGWLFVFGLEPNSRGLDLSRLPQGWDEACGFSIDLQRRSYLCLRYRQGKLIRRLEQRGDGSLVQEGRRGQKREPALSVDGGPERLDAWAVLEMASAWQCDPRAALSARAEAWVLEPIPGWSGSRQRTPWDWLAILAFVLAPVLLVVLAIGWVDGGEQQGLFASETCSSQESCEACTRCALSTPAHSCAALARTCNESEPCRALWSCFDRCKAEHRQVLEGVDLSALGPEGLTLDFSCESQCQQTHPPGVEGYRAWRSCTICEACERTCGWMDGLNLGELQLVECSTR